MTAVRPLAALALVAAPAVTTVALAVDPTPQADTTADLLALVTTGTPSWSTGVLLFLLSGLLWVPAGIGLLRLFGTRRPLGWWGAAAVLVGGVAIVPLDTAGLYLPGLASSGVPPADQVAIVEGVEASPTLMVFEIVHVAGLFAGLLVVAVALLRSRLVPAWAPACIVVGLIALLAVPQQAVQTAAMALVTVALGAVALHVLRLSDGEWRQGAARPVTDGIPSPA